MTQHTNTYDLAVIGAGAGGFGAALAGARSGLNTLLIEKTDTLGGNAVRGGVNCWEMGGGGTGIPFDLYRRLKRIPQAVGIYSYHRHGCWYNPAHAPYRFPGGEQRIDPERRYIDTLRRHGSKGLVDDEAFCREYWHGVPFEPGAMSRVMREMLEETDRCTILMKTGFTRVCHHNGRITAIELDGGQTITARMVVDATADAHVCAAAGCETMMGQETQSVFNEPGAPEEPSGRINGVTLIYRISPCEPPAILPLPGDIPDVCWWRDSFPWTSITQYPNGDFNMNVLPTMEGDEFIERGYQAAYEECRRRILAHWHDLQRCYEEFQRFRMTWIAPGLGIRESRRVVCAYMLTQHDLLAGLSGQQHEDIICIADHATDTHGQHGHGCGELSEPYGVPYRCLIPRGFKNLLTACRAAGFSALAASSCRLTRTMIQLGQAAGVAASIADRLDVELSAVPPGELRHALQAQHVQLEHPMPETLRQHLMDEDKP